MTSFPTSLRRSALRASLVLWLAAGAAPALRAQAVEGEEPVITGFSIPQTRAARARLERALGHVEGKRWNEAIEDLQVLLEEHAGELLHAGGPISSPGGVYRGVAEEARRVLALLPPEARDLYDRRFARRAQAALALARAHGDRHAVVEVARRWPLCPAAAEAWWTLGDLELELGNLDEARSAWSRALRARLEAAGGEAEAEAPVHLAASPERWGEAIAALEALGAPLAAGELARLELARATRDPEHPLALAAHERLTPAGSLRLVTPAEAPLGAPDETASAWPKPFRIPTPHPFDRPAGQNLFPVRVGDTVLVSNSLQLFAVNAYSGALRWAGALPAGWARLDREEAHQFFKGVDDRGAMIAPAASDRVAVAALQVPVTDLTNETYRSIAITTIIPDRRLYAYDVETGRELWNHHPPPGWDFDSGTFAERMSVAGPPVVHAGRVLVPMHRMYGRIEFYVACFDLDSGALEWATQLVSGQRELNMFARAETEFSAPPVHVAGDRVIVLTQLGAVAALDLFSGAVVWETLYEQIPPPERDTFSASRLPNKWRNAPPAVTDDVVVVTPFDGLDLVGLDLATGDPLWTVQYAWIQHLAGGRGARVDLLVGADDRHVYLGTWPVVALEARGGLAAESPRALAWRFPSGDLSGNEATDARPVLLADRMVVPWRGERVEIELSSGRRRSKPVPWQSGRSGNLLADGGSLYALDSRYLDGYFEWDVLFARARRAHAESPDAPEPALYLAQLLAQRGRAEADDGRSEAARDWLDEAAVLLADLLERGGATKDARRELHGVLRARARVFVDLADVRRALGELRAARALAPDEAELRDTLIEEYELVRGEDEAAQREVLDLLDARCADRALVTRLRADESRAAGWRFVPLAAGEEADFDTVDVEVPLWTALERRELFAADGDVAGELTVLHRLLEEYPHREVPDGELGERASADIAALLERHGRAAYAPFEEAAQELYDEALAGEDQELMALVAEYYPHSLAAHAAYDTLLGWAAGAGDVQAVAHYALAGLPERWAPERATSRELELVAHLGASLAAAGNLQAARSLYGVLAAVAPEQPSRAARDGGASFAQVAESLGPQPLPPLPAPAGFAADALPEVQVPGEHEYLGRIPPVGDGRTEASDVLLFARTVGDRGRASSLVAYSPASVGGITPQRLWEIGLPARVQPSSWSRSVVLLPGELVAATDEEVYALDRETGRWRWTWSSRDGDVETLTAADGFVYVTTRSRARGTQSILTALDAAGGAELWSFVFDVHEFDRAPLAGSGRIVLLPRHDSRVGRVFDAFSGRPAAEFELPQNALTASASGAWIEGGLLVVPWFLAGRNPELNRIVAIDLVTGGLSWDLDLDRLLGGKRELRAIVQYGGHSFLWLQARSGFEREGVEGLLVELHVGLGATAALNGLRLGREDRLLGVGQDRRVELEEPWLYVSTFLEGSEQLRVQQLELPSGALRWSQRLSVTRSELFNTQVRLPATGRNSVALALALADEPRRGASDPPRGASETRLYFLDARTGRPQGNQRLEPKLGSVVDLTLHGVGGALLVAGKGLLEVMR
ncbi:MAG: PQQ-binding-like beta-propeller repeat protein [Planctomycetes bacterium]|nr:PQQ-binding-like beta-propeller repeat protein [Planctomycetota bacterium]